MPELGKATYKLEVDADEFYAELQAARLAAKNYARDTAADLGVQDLAFGKLSTRMMETVGLYRAARAEASGLRKSVDGIGDGDGFARMANDVGLLNARFREADAIVSGIEARMTSLSEKVGKGQTIGIDTAAAEKDLARMNRMLDRFYRDAKARTIQMDRDLSRQFGIPGGGSRGGFFSRLLNVAYATPGGGGPGWASESNALSSPALAAMIAGGGRASSSTPLGPASAGARVNDGSNRNNQLFAMMEKELRQSLRPVATLGPGGGAPADEMAYFSDLVAAKTAQTLTGGGGGGGGGGGLAALLGGLFGRGRGGGNRTPVGRRLGIGAGFMGMAGIGTAAGFAGLGAEHIIAIGAGLATSAAAGAIGGGLVAAGSAGTMAAGMGANYLVNRTTSQNIKATNQAYNNLQTAIQNYGKGSVAATQAQKAFNQQLAGLPKGTAAAYAAMARQVSNLKNNWQQASAGAQLASLRMRSDVLKVAQAFVTPVAHAGQRNITAATAALQPLFAWLKGPSGMGVFTDLENNFFSHIKTDMHAFSQLFELVAKSLQFISNLNQQSWLAGNSFMQRLDEHLTKWNSPAGFLGVETHIQKLINDFHVWDSFVKILAIDVVGLFKGSVGTGNSIIQSLTGMLDKLRQWELSTAGQGSLNNIFQAHKQQILQLLQLLPALVKGFGSIYMAIAPPLVGVTTMFLKDVVVPIANGLGAIASSSHAAGLAIGGMLVAWKAGALGPLVNGLRSVAVSMGLMTAKVTETQALTNALRENTGALVDNSLAASGDQAALGRLAGAEAVGGAGAGGAAAKGGLLARLAGLGGIGLAGLTAGAGAVGLVGGAGVANSVHAHGVARGAIMGGGAGLGAGALYGAATLAGFGPLGMAAGAVIGGAIGAGAGAIIGAGLAGAIGLFISHAPSYGERFAHKFIAPFGNRLANSLEPALARAADRFAARSRPTQTISNGKMTMVVPGSPAGDTAKNAFNYGWLAGKATVAGLQNARLMTQPQMIQDFLGRLQALPDRARPEAAKVMLEYAHELEKNGRLPRGALKATFDAMTAYFPGLVGDFKTLGAITDKTLAAALDLPAAQKTLSASVKNMNQILGLMIPANKLTFDSLVSNAGTALGQLRVDMRSKNQLIVQEATQQYQVLKTQVLKYLTDMSAGAKTNLAPFVANVDAAMQSGVLATGKGMSMIIKATNDALKAMGQHPLSLASVGAMTLNAGKVGQLVARGAAGGGYIGRPGERGQDEVPIVVGRGEAVLNHGQQAVVNAALRARGMAGGLAELFTRYGAPHAMAGGGFAGGGTASYSRLEGLWDSAGGPRSVASIAAAIAMAESGGREVMQQGQPWATTGWGLWQITPGGPQYLDDMVNARAAVAKYRGAGDTFRPWTTYMDGAYKAFLRNGVGASLTSIGVPAIRGASAVSAVARGAMRHIASAANSYLNSIGVGGAGGAAGHAFRAGRLTFPLPGGSWTPGEVDQGWDIAAPAHTPEFAVGPGTIVGHGISGFGPWAPILQLDGGASVYYGHAGPGHWTPAGAHVRAGQAISEIGAGIVGKSTGPHLEIGFYPPGGPGSGIAMKHALGFARGGVAGGPRPTSIGAQRRSHHPMPRQANHRTTLDQSLTSAFSLIPDAQNFYSNLANPFNQWITALTNQQNLLSQINGGPNQPTTLSATDTQYGPSDISLVDNPAFVAGLPNISYGNPPQQVMFPGVQSPRWGDGYNIYQADIDNANAQIQTYQSQLVAWWNAAVMIGQAVKQRKARQTRLSARMRFDLDRIQMISAQRAKIKAEQWNLQQDIRKMTTGSLNARLAAAKSAYSRLANTGYLLGLKSAANARIRAAMGAQQMAQASLAAEQALGPAGNVAIMNADRATIAREQSYILNEQGYIAGVTSLQQAASQALAQRNARGQITAANQAIAVNALRNESVVLGHQDSVLAGSVSVYKNELGLLGGNQSRIGTGGEWGVTVSDLKALDAGMTSINGDVSNIQTSLIPGLQLTIRGYGGQLAASAGGGPGGGPGNANDQLIISLLQQQVQALQTDLFASNALSPVMASFFKNYVGSYEVGTSFVPETGFAQVHAGEAIIPAKLNPFTARGGGPSEVHIHGLGDFVDRVEAVVDGKKKDISHFIDHTAAAGARARRLLPGPMPL